ncbi:MAG TPA: M14 family zinc carboxypeptidase [Actinophytocola sp.]|uniref:M14 family zinc carboxypeptidase n=1 Tax=Actinophytocola sp. TaxID=1872138 RepID=UPI002DDCA2F0|nr:M14 family zinc carboxypeptidase [Actinophytocola sp.]HEV2780860.1 M14 family zinc carboxypeptidase [Actinophytocola sp.]
MLRTAAALGLTGAVVVGLASSTATAVDNTLRSDRAVPRSCTARLLPAGTPGVDQREFTSTVDGLIQARLRPQAGQEGDWDLAVFDKATGGIVAGSAALRSRELAESFVAKDQQLVVQGCRYAGPGRAVTLGVDFLALKPDGTPSGAAAATAPQRAEMVRVETPTRQDKARLQVLGLDLTEKADATSVHVVLANDADRKTLADSGLRFQVVDGDLSATARTNAERDRRYAAERAASALPSGRTSYRHLYEYDFELKELARRNPNLVKAFTLPLPSIEGRDVVGVEIATDVNNVNDGKAVNFTMGVHHAREWPASEHAIEWAYELVNGFRSDPQIRDLVSKTRNIVVPIVNVDGFSISREAQPRGDFTRFDYEMKRKNCQVNDSPPAFRTGVCMANPAGRVRGTDPNRNYAGFWGGPGASPNWSSDTFRGGAPFSEPETQNVRQIVSTRQVTNLITLHTFSNLVLRPPGAHDAARPLDEPAYRALGDKMASRNGYISQHGFQLYDTHGTTEDWSYWATGGWGFTFEVGPNEFHPAYETGVVAEYLGLAPAAGAGKGGNRQAFLDMLADTANPASHSTIIGSAPRGYQLQLRKTFQTPTVPVLQPDGTTGPPIFVTDTLTSDLTASGGRFAWSVNPSTRPFVAGQYGRVPQAPAQGPIEGLANPAGVPAENTNYPLDPTAERIPFHVDGMPNVDNGKMTVSVNWTSDATDWDLYILGPDGRQVSSSAQGGTNFETAALFDPPPGDYTAVLVNFDQADPANVDDWSNLRVEFASPTPPVYGPKEAYTLTCSNRQGRLVGLADVFVDRGQTVDVGDVCTRSAREAKLRSQR